MSVIKGLYRLINQTQDHIRAIDKDIEDLTRDRKALEQELLEYKRELEKEKGMDGGGGGRAWEDFSSYKPLVPFANQDHVRDRFFKEKMGLQ